jgi:catechol 2,3-dioxygenase-like lactoylglutathione lyase family enzyme
MSMLQLSPLYAYLPARDLERARRFYEETLGFVPKSVNNGGVTYAFGGGTAAFLYPTENAGTSKASQAFWSVEDVDREIVELKTRGVVFERYDDMPGERSSDGAVIAGGAKAAWFRDSEGNILAIIQTL